MVKTQTKKLKETTKEIKNENKISAQDLQDEIFKKMSADKKIELASQLWKLGKELNNKHFHYGTNRSTTSFG